MQTILVFNASGLQGNAICNRLISSNHKIIAPVRSEKNVAILKDRGIDAHLTDHTVDSLSTLIRKADKLVLQIPAQVSPSTMLALANNATEAIAKAGAPPTVFVISSTVPNQMTGKTSPDVRLQMKQMAQQRIPNAIILSATEYLENFSTSYREAIMKQGIIPQTIPAHLPVNYMSWQDLAIYVEACLADNSLEGGFYPIGGLEGINGLMLAERLGKIIGKKLNYQTLSHQQFAGFLSSIVGEQLAGELAEFYEWQDTVGSSLLNPDTSILRSRLNIDLTSFEEWATKVFS